MSEPLQPNTQPAGSPPGPKHTANDSTRRPRRRRGIAITLIVLGGLVIAGMAWIAGTGLLAKRELTMVRADIASLRTAVSTGNMSDARQLSDRIRDHAARAHQLTTGPAWYLAATLPAVGDPARSVREIANSADALGSDVLPQLIGASTALTGPNLRRPSGGFDFAPIVTVIPSVESAAAIIDTAAQRMSALPEHTWLSAVDRARTEMSEQLTSVAKSLRTTSASLRVIPELLGQQGAKTYLLAFQNDAEARGTGGLPGAFAIVTADRGALRFDRFESDSALFGAHADVDFGPDYQQLYKGAGTTTLYGNANISPHFPYAAQIWASMWKQRSGQQVDGVMAVDPSALSYLLAATGPATLPNGSQVTAANVVALTQSAAYAKFPTPRQNDARREYLLDIARAVGSRLVAQHSDSVALVKAVQRAVGERRLLVWSANETVQDDLVQASAAGVVPQTSAPYAGLSIVNDGGNKLDYYLDRSLHWQRSGCGPTREVTVTVTLTNNAPTTGLSYYVTHRGDAHSYPVKPGDNRLLVAYSATTGALMNSVTVDGTPATATAGVERGHPVYTVDLELPRGATRTIRLSLSEPAAAGAIVLLRQPLVRPLSVVVSDSDCS